MKNFKSDNSSGKNHEGVYPNSPLRYLTATSIIGDKVFNKKDEHMGEIKDIMIDLTSGNIAYLIIELGGFLGIGEKYFAFRYSELTVDSANETFILDRNPEALKKMPGFDKDHWPDTNTHEFDNSGGFMGVNTGSVPYTLRYDSC